MQKIHTNEILIMITEQLAQARKLITQKCRNYDKGNCLALDGNETTTHSFPWIASYLCDKVCASFFVFGIFSTFAFVYNAQFLDG